MIPAFVLLLILAVGIIALPTGGKVLLLVFLILFAVGAAARAANDLKEGGPWPAVNGLPLVEIVVAVICALFLLALLVRLLAGSSGAMPLPPAVFSDNGKEILIWMV